MPSSRDVFFNMSIYKDEESGWKVRTEGNYFSGEQKRKDQLFVDDFLEKHQRLLKVL